jgi:hypothetical protein
MNNKRMIINIGTIGAAAILLVGCSGTINHNGKSKTIEQAEESIEAQLEKENPGKDYEVDINSEYKKKKRGKRK